jgi:hypothetical protein
MYTDNQFSPADQRPAYDPERTLRFGIFGLAMGPLIGRWLRLLERHIPMVKAAAGASGAGTTSTGIQLAKRVLADQVVMYVSPPLWLHISSSYTLIFSEDGHNSPPYPA